ncbi:MAG: hypothetical protein M1337_04745 [Actinobacteria bacterium]|nr:hypothetical protein [Actinomycetota bacterium]
MSESDFSDWSEEEIQRYAAQLPVLRVVWAFLEAFIRDRDVETAWRYMSPEFRRSLAHRWTATVSRAVEIVGQDREEFATALAIDGPQHERWANFRKVLVRDLADMVPADRYDELSAGGTPNVVGVDLEVVHIHLTRPEGGILQPGAESIVLPLVVRHRDNEWLIDAFGTEEPSA